MKTALITGASSGIGLELAKIIAKDNYNLVLVARNADKLNQLKSELEKDYNISVAVLPKDLADPNVPNQISQELANQNIQIDLLVNNAGFGVFGLFKETDWEKEQQMIQLNVTALTHLTKLFVQGMIERKSGQILNVASTAAFQPGPLMAGYYATKSYVLSFSCAIAHELKGTGVSVTTLCPGATASGFQAAAQLEKAKIVNMRKMPSSKEVAEFGWQALKKGKLIAVHGLLNRVMAFSVRFVPTKIVTRIAHNLQKEQQEK